MTLIFLSLAVIIAIVVILVSAKFIKAGFDARSEVKDQIRNENISCLLYNISEPTRRRH